MEESRHSSDYSASDGGRRMNFPSSSLINYFVETADLFGLSRHNPLVLPHVESVGLDKV